MAIENFGIAEVKAKIRCIRNVYMLEVAKIIKSELSGTAGNKIYKPRLAWFPVADRILHHVVQIGKSQSSLNTVSALLVNKIFITHYFSLQQLF